MDMPNLVISSTLVRHNNKYISGLTTDITRKDYQQKQREHKETGGEINLYMGNTLGNTNETYK